MCDRVLTRCRTSRYGPRRWNGSRTRKLEHKLDLRANGGATILQDDLQNTYQLAVRTRPRGPRRAHALSLVVDGGTVTGTPFGPGRVEIRGTTIRLVYPKGSIEGTTSPSAITFNFGTGAYRGITSGALPVSASERRMTLEGSVTY